MSITFYAEIKTKQELIVMKIDTHNFLGDRFSSISNINRLPISIILIDIDYIDYWFSSIGHAGRKQSQAHQ